MANAKPQIVDVGATCADLRLYKLRAVSAPLSISGIFVDTNNARVGMPVTGSISELSSTGFEDLYAALYDPGDYPFPEQAVGFIGNISGSSDLAFDISGASADSPTIDEDVTLYPHLTPSASQTMTFGRVFNR